ncbi:UNVERIFIED_CONTAM: hypothetical protein Sradi_2840800 [Sesamum radiatum]|uniref:AB hydrolase-1 domain-containing protein n=1 Tax=Sesamum radiatum TaxID=300843 RepID=A0AAW2RX94_SESRA
MMFCFHYQVFCTDHVEQKKELIQALIKDRQLSKVPRIEQPTLIIWGEQDRIFPQELGYRLEKHIGDNAKLVMIKNAGHAVNIEKPKEFAKNLKSFLIDSRLSPRSKSSSHRHKHFLIWPSS